LGPDPVTRTSQTSPIDASAYNPASQEEWQCH